MKAGQHCFPFHGIQRPRHKPHGGNRRRNNPRKPLPIKRRTRKIEGLASGSDSDRRRKISDGRSHDASVSAIGMPNSIATFFERRSRSPPCAADRSGARCRVAVSDSPRSADWPSTSALAFAQPNLPGFRPCVPGATLSDAKNTDHAAEARRRSHRTLSPHPLRPGPSAYTRPCTCAVSREPKPPDSGGALRARPHRHLVRNQILPSHPQPAGQNRSSLPY